MYLSPEIIYPQQDFLDKLEQFPKHCAQNIFMQVFGKLIEGTVTLYTDGSKVDDSTYVGSACYSPLPRTQLMYKIPSRASVFSAEAWAIYNAILLILDINAPEATIISDSMSVLKALQETTLNQNNYLIPLIKAKLEAARKLKIHIQFIWIPSHKGIHGNEIADELARRTTKEGITCNFKVPYSDFFSVPREKLNFDFDKYIEHWARCKGTAFFEKIYQKRRKPWYYRTSLTREAIVTISRIRANHYNLNHSLFRKNLSDNPACPYGYPSQDINHIVFNCPNTREKSSYLKVAITNLVGPLTDNIFDILKNPSGKICRLITAFLKACKMNI